MLLNICLIGKYFPIQGGVSKDNQWLAYFLAKAGFQVHIVTNAEEVEPAYRCLNWTTFPMLPPECSGSITLHTTDKANRRHYIPYANPFVTKLASLATDVLRTSQCELLYSYYLEPYAVAASLASRWTGIPYGLRHAGSDVGTLLQSPELQTAYREVILAADYLVATPATYRSFLHLGVPQDKLYFPAEVPLSPAFSPDAVPLDVNALLTWMRSNLPTDPYYDVFRHFSQKFFHPGVPTIGIYGKIGAVKGSFDLLQALGCLQREGVAFQLLSLTQGSPAILAEFAAAIEAQGLTNVTWLLPFLPHWAVPQFLRACAAVCALERDFPIPIHTPLIPQEVFACGTCLVLSHELAEKQPAHEQLRHGTNVFIVNPHDHAELAAVLRTVIQDPSASRRIGRQGFHERADRRHMMGTDETGWQRLFLRIYGDIQQRRQAVSLMEMQSYLAQLSTDETLRKLFAIAPEASFEPYLLTETEKQVLRTLDQKLLEYFATSLKMKQQERLRSVYQSTFALPKTLMLRLFNRFYHLYPARPHEDFFQRLIDFGVFMEQTLAVDEQAPSYPSEVVKFERLQYLYTYQPLPEDAFSAINTQQSREALPLRLESVPLLSPGIYHEAFVYPLVEIVTALSEQRLPEEETILPGRYDLVFQRELHSLTLNIFVINAETALLLDLCQGENTVATLIETVERHLGETGLADDILAMLSTLQEKQLIGVRDELPE